MSSFNEMIIFLRGLMPTQTQIEWGTAMAALGTMATYIFGCGGAVEALVCAMGIDYLSGLLAAYINPHLALNSQKGFKGICKKLMILLMVSLAHFVDMATGSSVVHIVVVWFFLGNEGLSIIENAAKAGVPIPKKLTNTLEQLAIEKRVKKGE